jgi:kynurenine 3-monooxygenase
MVTFSPDIPYAEALRIGDLQKEVMDRVMQLPDIERDWDELYVINQLHELATGILGDQT